MSSKKTKDGTTDCIPLACSSGQIEVVDIIETINCMAAKCSTVEICCNEVKTKNKIRTYRASGVPHVLYMTDDGSDPHP